MSKIEIPSISYKDAQSGAVSHGLDRLRPRGAYVTGETYYFMDFLEQSGYQGFCRVSETTEPLAPQSLVDPTNIYGGAYPVQSSTAKQIIAGQRYTGQAGRVFNIKGFTLRTTAGQRYSVYSVLMRGGEEILNLVIDFVAGETGVQTQYVAESFLQEGETFDLVSVTPAPDPTPIEVSGNWDFEARNNIGAPASGEIKQDNRAPASLRISTIDNDGGDRRAELAALGFGDGIAGANRDWIIQNSIDHGTYFEFGVSPAELGTAAGVQNFTFSTQSATPIEYITDPAYYDGSSSVQGIFGIDTAYEDIAPDAGGYGMDLIIGEVAISDHWYVYGQQPPESNVSKAAQSVSRLVE